jgi:hypothetical protein
MADDISYQQIELNFRREIFTAVASRISAVLSGPAQLNCKLRAGAGRMTLIPMMGQDVFSLVGVDLGYLRGDQVLQFRLAPQAPQEYSYAVVQEQDFSLFDWKFMSPPPQTNPGNLSFGALYQRVLNEPHSKGQTWGSVMRAALEHERKKITSQQVSAHADYGIW